MTDITLYDYPKSSASYRVRIALNLAELNYTKVNVDLLSGAQSDTDHMSRNPQGFVPVLDIDGLRLTQSLAILDYLDRTRNMGLLPNDAADRARQQALATAIAVDLHPVCNLSVAERATGGVDPARTEWMQYYIGKGLIAFETLLGQFAQAPYCCGDRSSLADICLIPQLYNADRWGISLDQMPRIRAVRETCDKVLAFSDAHPNNGTK